MTNKEKGEEKRLNRLFRKRYKAHGPRKCERKQTRWYPGKYKGDRESIEYYNWRKAVLQRDDYKCVQCGQIGGKLHAHHRLSFFHNKNLRFDVDNGITLCIQCHEDLHGFIIGSKVS